MPTTSIPCPALLFQPLRDFTFLSAYLSESVYFNIPTHETASLIGRRVHNATIETDTLRHVSESYLWHPVMLVPEASLLALASSPLPDLCGNALIGERKRGY